jgi:manganese/zinc/iron transport system substrate-binding protein
MKRHLLLLGILALAGCNSGVAAKRGTGTHSGRYPIQVVATTGMVADLVRNVGGPHVNVTQLMNAGVDPHLYKASPGDIRHLSEKDAVFYSGKHLEGKLADVLENLAKTKRSVAVTDGIKDADLLQNEEGVFDPHLWFDVALWQQACLRVKDVLCEFDPTHAEDYRQAWQKYDAELTKLHQETKQRLATIEPSRRVLVTAHDAFRYFGRAYSIEVKSIQGISTESEASLKHVNELVTFIVERKIKAVFVESSVPEKNIKALVEGCADRKHPVVIGGELFSDAMGPEGTPEGTYVGMVRHNVETIVKALK